MIMDILNPIFERSKVLTDGSSVIDDDYRTSSTAHLGRSQTAVVKCIEKRFAQFQGDFDPLRIEPLQVVKYESNQEYKPHFDWFDNTSQLTIGGQRITTFFTYLHANGTDGVTEFVNITFNQSLHSRFCKILICDETLENYGIRFQPIPGNSIFWFNIDGEGNGDVFTLHAGRPPGKNGQKIGLNTWTRETIYVST